jgi:hypothetical protein
MYNWPELPVLTKAEARLQHDAVFGFIDYPDDLQKRDDYFCEGFTLIRTLKSQTAKVREVISYYARFATDPDLRLTFETFLQSLPTPPKKEEPDDRRDR